MRKQLSVLCLSVLCSAALQGAAWSAGDSSWYSSYSDRDGHWSWHDFLKANRDWYRVHPGVEQMSDRELYRRFHILDRDHDRYLAEEQVSGFHEDWNK